MEKRTALVTGCAGYLGSHLAKSLKQSGWKVVGLDYKKHTLNPYVDVMHYADIRNIGELNDLFSRIQFDTVFHLAARIEAGISFEQPTEFYSVNTGGTCNIASGLNYVIFRYFNLSGADVDAEFGEEHDPETHLIPRLIENLNNFKINGSNYNTPDGTCIRDYVHVADIADAHNSAANYLKSNKSIILNLGTGKGHSILEIITELEKITGNKINYTFGERRPGDADSLVADINLATEVLQYRPKHDIISILKTAYDWHNRNDE